MSFNSKYEQFEEALTGEYEGIGEDLLQTIKMCLEQTGFSEACEAGPSDEPNREGKTQKLTGYNLFYKENNPILKEQKLKGRGALMKEMGRRWTALSKAEKEEWKAKAEQSPAVPIKSKSKKGKKALTGWNLYYGEKATAMKTDPSVPKGNHMKEISVMWKGLTKDQQKIYKDKAAAMA